MKKLYFMAMAAAMLGLASCSSDEPLFDGADGEEVTVNYTISLPSQLASRAYGDATEVKHLHYAVYATGTKTPLLQGEETSFFSSGLQNSLPLSLVKGKSYDLVFWADAPDQEIYTFNRTTQQVSVDYSKVTGHFCEKADAFFATVKNFKVDGSQPETVHMYRPFAQLNIGTDDVALTHPTVNAVSVTVPVYSKFDLYSGEVIGNATNVTFGPTAISNAETFPMGSTYAYLAMDYLLVNQRELVTVTMQTDDATAEPRVYNNVPVQRNYRTNIYGSLLTSSVAFNIKIEKDFEQPDLKPTTTVEPQNLKAAIEAAESGDIIAVSESGDITQQLLNLSGVSGKDITIIGASTSSASLIGKRPVSRSGENFTYINMSAVPKVTGDAGYILRLGGLGNVTFKNIKIISPSSEYHGLHSAASITYDNCTIEGTLTGYTPQKFVDCTFNYSSKYTVWSWGSATISFDGCTFNSSESEKSRGLLLYAYNASRVDATVSNCVFNGIAASGDKCAIEIHTELGLYGSLTINNCTVSGSGWLNENGGLWREVNNYKGTNGEATFNFDVYVDGVHVQAPIVKGSSGEYIIDNPLAFKQVLTNVVNNASAPVVVDITSDIDMSGVEYKHSDLGYNGPHPTKHITIKGNGHTISNLEVNGLQAALLPWTASGFTISGLNLKNCKFTGTNVDNSYCNAAAFGAFCDGTSVSVSDCTLDGVTIGHAKYVGGFVAYCSGKESKFENCVVKNCTIINDYNESGTYKGHCGGLIGGSYGATITNCTVQNNNFQVQGDRNGIFAGSLWGNGMSGTASASGNTGLSVNVGSVGTALFTATVN